jgi:hypothetical protein
MSGTRHHRGGERLLVADQVQKVYRSPVRPAPGMLNDDHRDIDHNRGAPAIEVDGLVKTYGAVRVVDGVSLTVGEGEFFGILGPNGARLVVVASLAAVKASQGQAYPVSADHAAGPLSDRAQSERPPEAASLWASPCLGSSPALGKSHTRRPSLRRDQPVQALQFPQLPAGHNRGRRRVVKSRSWTAGERPRNGWRPGDRDSPEPVILPRPRGGRGR